METSLLRFPRLKSLARKLETKAAGFEWQHLYATQMILDLLKDSEFEHANVLCDLVLNIFRSVENGQTSLVLDDYCFRNGHANYSRGFAPQADDIAYTDCSGLNELLNQLSVCAVPDTLSERADNAPPLVLDKGRLYFRSYWLKENEVEGWIKHCLSKSVSLPSTKSLLVVKHSINALFYPRLRDVVSDNLEQNVKHEINMQARAVATSVLSPLTIISGGPGTGKTTTAASLLCVLHAVRTIDGLPLAKIRLLAPTGKAAVRLLDSIKGQIDRIELVIKKSIQNCLPEADIDFCSLASALPDASQTIHKYLYELNALPGASDKKAFNRIESLLSVNESAHSEADIIVIDECSMIDLNIMHALSSVISHKTKVIMLGDPFQLPPVEPGRVFASFVAPDYFNSVLVNDDQLAGYLSDGQTEDNSELEELIGQGNVSASPLVKLDKTYRFDGDLKSAAQQINQGDFASFSLDFSYCENDPKEKHVRWINLVDVPDFTQRILNGYQAYFSLLKRRPSLDELADCFAQFQCLCATYEGVMGVNAINLTLERTLNLASYRSTQSLYVGKPVLVTKNYHHLSISNGDIGFVLMDDDGEFQFVFPQAGSEALSVSPYRIDAWLPAYAMTVHKSQGSEYKNVSLLLADYSEELLSRELLYTGLTRAKVSCEILAAKSALRSAFN